MKYLKTWQRRNFSSNFLWIFREGGGQLSNWMNKLIQIDYFIFHLDPNSLVFYFSDLSGKKSHVSEKKVWKEKTWDFWLFWSSKRSLSGLTPIEDDFVLENSSSDQGHLQGSKHYH